MHRLWLGAVLTVSVAVGVIGLPCARPTSAAEAPSHSGSAVIAVVADPGHLNPAVSTASNVHAVADSMFNGLLALDRDLVPVPDLAESWTVNNDSTAFTLVLAPGIRWHDGAKLTSADVKFTFEEVLFKYHARTRAGLGAAVASIETPDERTVVFRLKQPYRSLLQGLDVTEAPILPKHVFSGGDPNTNPANLKPIGTARSASTHTAPARARHWCATRIISKPDCPISTRW